MPGGGCRWGQPWPEASSAQGLGSRKTPVFGGEEGRDGGMYILRGGIFQSVPSCPRAAPKPVLLLATVTDLCDARVIQAGQQASRKVGI